MGCVGGGRSGGREGGAGESERGVWRGDSNVLRDLLLAWAPEVVVCGWGGKAENKEEAGRGGYGTTFDQSIRPFIHATIDGRTLPLILIPSVECIATHPLTLPPSHSFPSPALGVDRSLTWRRRMGAAETATTMAARAAAERKKRAIFFGVGVG